MISKVRMKTTRSDNVMAYVDIEDQTGSIELIVFPKTLERCSAYLREDTGVVVKGEFRIGRTVTLKFCVIL